MGHKSSLGKLKKTEIIPVIFSDHSAVSLDLNYMKKIIKNLNIWRLNNTLLNNITHYQRNANQNHNEVPLHASQDGFYPKVYKQ